MTDEELRLVRGIQEDREGGIDFYVPLIFLALNRVVDRMQDKEYTDRLTPGVIMGIVEEALDDVNAFFGEDEVEGL